MQVDVAIIGAGAAGMMCAAHAPGRVLLVDHAKAPGEKIRISGGGRCNFTNLNCGPHAFLSDNPHFAKSALARYTQWDFIDLVNRHGIGWHEKTLGQLFCDGSARDIVAMLSRLLAKNAVDLRLQTSVKDVSRSAEGFTFLMVQDGKASPVSARRLVVATGGKSIPKMGASGFAYDIARQFGLPVTPTRPALVPFTFPDGRFSPLSGVSLPVRIEANGQTFHEAMLFTHRGLSGPAILQISSYWREGGTLSVDLLPATTIAETMAAAKRVNGKRKLTTLLVSLLPQRLVEHLAAQIDLNGNIGDLSQARLTAVAESLHAWPLLPAGTEGYRTAEVTLGGVDTSALEARSMEARAVQGLYFIGEAADVTGWLGGYNFQWAWSSAMAAAQALRDAP